MTLDARLGLLNDQHAWMEPQLQVALARSSTDNAGLLGVAQSMKDTLLRTWDGWQSAFDDPLLQRQDTGGLALRRYLSQAIGPWPVAEGSLGHMQGELAKRGFGADLPQTGAWDPQWNAAYNEYLRAATGEQLAGKQPGSAMTTRVLHGLMDAITPKGMAHHLIGFAKSLPGQARALLADLANAGATVGALPVSLIGGAGQSLDYLREGEVAKGLLEPARRSVEAGQTSGAAVESALWHDVSREQYAEEFASPGRLVDDIANIFLIADAFAVGGRIALAAGEGATKGLLKTTGRGLVDLTADEAKRGPGVIAKSLGRPLGQRIVVGGGVGATVGGVHAGLTGGNIGAEALGGAVAGAAIGASPVGKWALNLPVLSKAGPWVGRLADADGLYYKARTLLAQPYRIQGVRTAGEITGHLQAYSLKVTGAAGVAGALTGGRDPQARAVFGEHLLDPVDDAIRHRLSVRAFGKQFSVGMDDLALALHPPIGHGAGTLLERDAATLGDHVQGALGRVGIQGQIERGMGGLRFDDLTALAGGNPARAAKWLSYKVREMAAWHYGELAVRERGMAPMSRDWVRQVREEAGHAWAEPEVLNAAVASLANQPGEIERRLTREIAHSGLQPHRYAKQQLTQFLDAADATRALVRDHATSLITPDLAAAMRGADEEAAFGAALGLAPSGAEARAAISDRLGERVPGKVGLAAKGTLDAVEARQQLSVLQGAWAKAATEEGRAKVTADLLGWMHGNFNSDARMLGGFNDTDALFRWADGHAGELAHPVYLAADAPAAVRRLAKSVDDAGYKIVYGTDIGHFYEDGLPDLHVLDGRIGRLRRTLERFGVSPETVANTNVGTARYSAVRRRLQSLVDDGKITLPPYYTVDTVLADLSDDKVLARALPWAERAAFGAGERLHRGAAKQLARRAGQTVEGLPPERVAMAQIEQEIAASLHLRDVPRKDVMKLLTRTENVPWMTRAGDEALPLMDATSAAHVYRAVVRGSADVPARMVGWSRAEDLFRASAGFLGDVIPGNAGEALANLPNRLIQTRNRLRFELNPEFGFRRIAKTNVKMAAEGVVPTWRPLDRMAEQGVYDKAHAYLDRLQPRSGVEHLVESERYLHASDVFGLYSQRQYEAYAAWQWKAAGKTDDEVKRLLVRTFTYGSGATAGRSALERSLNTVFFPFSFQKTLYRNMGAYLLDRPAQLVMITRGLAAYHDFNEAHKDGTNPAAASWWERHVPLLNEALRLNAFAHGISAGERGGINAPLLNAFLPQSWDTSAHSVATMKRFIPALGELQRLSKEVPEQITIANNAARNSLDTTARWITGRQRDPLDPTPRVGTKDALLSDAFTMRRNLVDQLRPALDYNARHPDLVDKYRFPDDPAYGAMAGEVVNRDNIGWLVHRWYPVFDPAGAAKFAIARESEMKGWLIGLRTSDPARYDVYSRFFAEAKKASGYLADDRYTTEQASELTSQFRQAAIVLAGESADFHKRYNRYLKAAFGPLEALR